MPSTATLHLVPDQGFDTLQWHNSWSSGEVISEGVSRFEVDTILNFRHPQIVEVRFPSFDTRKIFSGGFAPSGLARMDSIIFEKDAFWDSGFMSIMKRNGEATGYSIATEIFMTYFKARNKWVSGFISWHNRPMAQAGYNFWQRFENFILGEAVFLDADGKKVSIPIFIIWKNGEWVLGQEAGKKALEEIVS